MAMSRKESARQSLLQIDASLRFVHWANIEKYKKQLEPDLSDSERLVVQRHLADEEASLLNYLTSDRFLESGT